MSDFQKGLFKKKIQEAEARLGMFPEDEEDDDTVAPLSMATMAPPRRRRRGGGTIEPKSWEGHFDQNFTVQNANGEFNVYFTPPEDKASPIFVFQHGAGSSALTFALLAKKIKEKMESDQRQQQEQAVEGNMASKNSSTKAAGALAFDMRGHGLTKVNDNSIDMFALNILVEDFLSVVESVWTKMGWDREEKEAPPVVLVGHSLGGSIVAQAANSRRIQKLVGLVILDVVEGLTMESLDSMNKVLASFPPQFDSLPSAIEWHLAHHHLRNKESAAVSVPALLTKKNEEGKVEGSGSGEYTWIMDLKRTEPYWRDWFEGLSSRFLKAPAARLLILAGTDRLDKELMIGQMQGKYQLMVFNEAGHFLHEDSPDKTALTLIDFWMRNGRPADIVPVFGKLRDPTK